MRNNISVATGLLATQRGTSALKQSGYCAAPHEQLVEQRPGHALLLPSIPESSLSSHLELQQTAHIIVV